MFSFSREKKNNHQGDYHTPAITIKGEKRMTTVFGLHIVDLIVIVVYFAVVLYIGYRAMKKVKNSEDYFLGGRQFGKFFQTFSQFGQATSTESAVQSVSMVGSNGLIAAFSTMLRGIPFNPITWL